MKTFLPVLLAGAFALVLTTSAAAADIVPGVVRPLRGHGCSAGHSGS